MPTGFTAYVQDGTVSRFEDFALLCARAFGACIELRDEPLAKPIPERFDPRDYHARKLESARQELRELEAMTDAECDSAARTEFAEERERVRKRHIEDAKHRARYEGMLAQVREWEPPTSEHQGLKDFMIEQLESSIRNDCPDPEEPEETELLSGKDWRSARAAWLAREVSHHARGYLAELARTEQHNRWVSQLRESLKGYGGSK